MSQTDERSRMDTYVSDLSTHIIKDASKTVSAQNDHQTPLEGTLTVSEKFDHSLTNHEFTHDGIQRRSGDGISNESDSLPENPTNDVVRSLSEPAIVNHQIIHEQSLPIRQDDSSSDNEDVHGIETAPMNVSGHPNDNQSEEEHPINNSLHDDDHDNFEIKAGTVDDNWSSSAVIKQDNRDETIRFRAIHTLPEETSTSTHSPDQTDHSPQSPQHNISLINHSRSPVLDDSQLNEENSQEKSLNEYHSTELDDNHVKDPLLKQCLPLESSKENISSTNRQHSTRPNSSHSSRLLTPNNELTHSSSTEQLQVPSNEFIVERLNSPPPTTVRGVRSIMLFNPLLKYSFTGTEQDQTRSPSEMSRKSSMTSVVGNERVIEDDIALSNNRRESVDNKKPLETIDSQSVSEHDDKSKESTERTSHSRRESNSELHDDELDNSQQKQSSREGSTIAEQEVFNKQGSLILESEVSDKQTNDQRKNSTDLKQQITTTEKQKSPIHRTNDIQTSSIKKDSTSLSNGSIRTTFSKHKQESSSSTENSTKYQRLSPLQRRLEDQSKRHSRLYTDKTTVTSIVANPSKSSLQNQKRTSATDSDFDRQISSKLPSVISSPQREKLTRSETSNTRLAPLLTDRSKQNKYTSSSPSEDEPSTRRWMKHASIPSMHFSNDKQSVRSREKGKQDHPPRRSASWNSSTHIPLVDDKSLDSTSARNTDPDEQNTKPKQNSTSTSKQPRQQSSSDELEPKRQKPLKATKPMSEHFHSARRRTSNRESLPNTHDRCTVTELNGSRQDKDPVNVNITLVVKKLSDGENSPTTTAEAFVNQDHQPTPNKKHSKQRSKSVGYHDHDGQQTITEKSKKHRPPKHISRTCQTYECVFRRIERERQSESRRLSASAKSNQQQKSQLRSRTISPKKYLSPYLMADPFRIEEILRKQYYQSRKHLSKSSPLVVNTSPRGGKLIIIRPTLPFHYTDAVDVRRICLQYAIDLVPQNPKSNHRSKSATTTNVSNKTHSNNKSQRANQNMASKKT
ncbi:unnamed protein product [Adineta ricciae]|uniref:Uncharacterized protein n=1 Tax=Adineta ricciae TaxID=249248 RepID=A0A814ARS9_ADIRI|nr:unnamed protein product [Adineta ricciae]